ncbi:hypothetical protein SDC9_133699 [bioreactor metagenome]|uniref:Uncharacterized protein n=1 Tax=bioreactor metagenome TaxID=1076179 RepID=A0A645DBM0_9ZZZZ
MDSKGSKRLGIFHIQGRAAANHSAEIATKSIKHTLEQLAPYIYAHSIKSKTQLHEQFELFFIMLLSGAVHDFSIHGFKEQRNHTHSIGCVFFQLLRNSFKARTDMCRYPFHHKYQ